MGQMVVVRCGSSERARISRVTRSLPFYFYFILFYLILFFSFNYFYFVLYYIILHYYIIIIIIITHYL